MGMVMNTMAAVPYAFIALSALGTTTTKLYAYVHPMTSVLAMMTYMQLYPYECMMVAMVSIVVYLVTTTSTTFKWPNE